MLFANVISHDLSAHNVCTWNRAEIWNLLLFHEFYNFSAFSFCVFNGDFHRRRFQMHAEHIAIAFIYL